MLNESKLSEEPVIDLETSEKLESMILTLPLYMPPFLVNAGEVFSNAQLINVRFDDLPMVNVSEISPELTNLIPLNVTSFGGFQ